MRFLSLHFISLALPVIFAFSVHAQWVQSYGPWGGLICCIMIDGNTVFAGTMHGVYASTDDGKSWSARGTTIHSTIAISVQASGTYAVVIYIMEGRKVAEYDMALSAGNHRISLSQLTMVNKIHVCRIMIIE